MEAIRSGKELDKVLIARKSESSLSRELLTLIKSNEIPFQFVPIEKINRISRKNHQGTLAFISPISYVPVEELVNQSFENGIDPMFILLDGISDVRNFGAIARSAECLGFNGIIIPQKGAAQVNADAVKTSAGALLKIRVSRVRSLVNTIKFLKDSGLSVVSVTEKASRACYQESLTGPVVLVMGSEESGISKNLLDLSDKMVKIPMGGETESLNVSVATSILMYEISRQRQEEDRDGSLP